MLGALGGESAAGISLLPVRRAAVLRVGRGVARRVLKAPESHSTLTAVDALLNDRVQVAAYLSESHGRHL